MHLHKDSEIRYCSIQNLVRCTICNRREYISDSAIRSDEKIRYQIRMYSLACQQDRSEIDYHLTRYYLTATVSGVSRRIVSRSDSDGGRTHGIGEKQTGIQCFLFRQIINSNHGLFLEERSSGMMTFDI